MSNKKESVKSSLSLIERIFRLFSGEGGGDSVEKQNKRLLKGLVEILKKRPKYYRFPTHEVQPAVAKFFFEIYLVVGPIKPFTQNLSRSEQIRSIVVEHFLPEEMREFVADMNGESVVHRFDSVDINEVKQTMKDQTEAIHACLQNRTLSSLVNITYAYMCSLAEFCSFDFYSLLKKFDPALPVANFEYKIEPQAVAAGQLIDDLDDFLVVSIPLLSGADWDQIFDILKNYRNTEVVNRHSWKKMLSSINDMISSQTFESIIKVVRNDPMMEIKATITTVDIIGPYLKKLARNVRTVVQKIEQNERRKMNEKIGRDLFMGADFGSSLRHYTKQRSKETFGEGFEGYEATEILSALVHFSNIYVDRDIKKLLDRLILIGKWSQNAHYKEFSDAVQNLLQNRIDILDFDASLTEDSNYVVRLRNLVRSPSRDKTALNSLTAEVNAKAFSLVRRANQNYAVIARSLRNYIDDYKKKPGSDLLLNWDDVGRDFERPLGRYMADLYTKIYQLMQMMQQYI